MIIDMPNSGVALAVSQIAANKNKLFIVSGAAASDLTGPKCNANTIHWTYDTWMLANGTGNAMVKTGGDTWFFLTSDYAFGHALERDTMAAVEKAAAKCSARCATRSTPTTSPRSCCRRRRRSSCTRSSRAGRRARRHHCRHESPPRARRLRTGAARARRGVVADRRARAVSRFVSPHRLAAMLRGPAEPGLATAPPRTRRRRSCARTSRRDR